MTLKLKKKDSLTGSTPQGNATLAGAVYQVSYQKGGQTVTEELTSDASGNLGTLEGLPLGTVTVKELTAPEGYRLDTESPHLYGGRFPTHRGCVRAGSGRSYRGRDAGWAVHSEAGFPRQGQHPRAMPSLEGISFEIVNDSQNPVVVNGNTAAPGAGLP